MDYPFEQLGPEKFQQFCQALLIREYPDVRCFPVGQPDGGRDAISYIKREKSQDFIVFQVKYVRKPLAEVNPQQWVTNVLEEEVQKIKKLIPKGAKRFLLITNVPGTAHLEVGSIDKSNEILKTIGLPADSWWREDLNRRLDSAWDLKWAYPELMTGPDLIRAMIESRLSDDKERRTTAIKAFIRDQYGIDEEVRFKQVELQNKLLELFIDVPVAARKIRDDGPSSAAFNIYQTVAHEIAMRNPSTKDLGPDSSHPIPDAFMHGSFFTRSNEKVNVGAATLLLHPLVQKDLPRIVIEGAPGQGKSTITQYVCQVHRMRLLSEQSSLQAIPVLHRLSPVRLPFKIDVRDFATWLSKKNPFSSGESELIPSNWIKSLEAFLAALVRHHSGGASFEVSDLHSIAKVSSILLVFDGLDEVADISRRQEVVDEIVKGINRIKENAISLQVVVTSRPAAFVNSPGLPQSLFQYFQLDSVTRHLIDEYANKWLGARKLQRPERTEVKKILKEKLGQPHLRDLARNPMQLAILLSLIHTRGSSLPDKRTALYGSYIELFFSREAEKSAIVRDHRDLLIEIHGYLAWILHTEAEGGQNSGIIGADRLQRVLSDYLNKEGHDACLLKTLFTGMVERVVALVSRVQGTFEFEVQPLREYFAARYLYETAPYSPPGRERKGTRPDRFDAIAKHFYWLNVTRFYAGCFSKGELPSLVDRLSELNKTKDYKRTSFPRVLAATLLSDWVFSQHPKSVQDIINLVLDDCGLRYIISTQDIRVGPDYSFILPKKCGKEELIARGFEILGKGPPADYAVSITELIKANSTEEELMQIWLPRVLAAQGSDRTTWLEHGLWLRLLHTLPVNILENSLSDDPYNVDRLSFLFRAERFEFLQSSQDRVERIVKAILDRDMKIGRSRPIKSFLDLFAHALNINRYIMAFDYDINHHIPLSEVWVHRGRIPGGMPGLSEEKERYPAFPIVDKCLEIIRVAATEASRSVQDWATLIEPWDNIVEKARSHFGDEWVFLHFANVASGIKSKNETCKAFPDLLAHNNSLCRRVRYARLRAGSRSWWLAQCNNVKDDKDIMYICTILLTWGSPTVLADLSERVNAFCVKLPEGNWKRLMDSVKHGCAILQRDQLFLDINSFPRDLAGRTVAVLGIRANEESRRSLYKKYLVTYGGSDSYVLEFCQAVAVDLLMTGPRNSRSLLKVIKKTYQKGVVGELYSVLMHEKGPLSITIAQRITDDPGKYPIELVAMAEAKCKELVVSKLIPVGQIAEQEGWFN